MSTLEAPLVETSSGSRRRRSASRHLRRRLARLLRLHRVRRRRDDGRGGAATPPSDLPRGILGSLAHLHDPLLRHRHRHDRHGRATTSSRRPASLAKGFEQVGKPGYATLISAGAVAGLTTVVMTLLIGSSRVVFAMSRDWLLPAGLGKVNRAHRHPAQDHRRHRAARRPRRRADADRQARVHDQHRHPHGVLPRVDRRARAAQAAAPTSTGRSGCRSPVAAVAVGRDLRLPHAHPAGRDVDPLRDLDGARVRHLLRLRLQALAPRRSRPARTTSRATPPDPPPDPNFCSPCGNREGPEDISRLRTLTVLAPVGLGCPQPLRSAPRSSTGSRTRLWRGRPRGPSCSPHEHPDRPVTARARHEPARALHDPAGPPSRACPPSLSSQAVRARSVLHPATRPVCRAPTSSTRPRLVVARGPAPSARRCCGTTPC